MRETAATKAARYITEGRLVVEAAGFGYFSATVRGGGDIHVVGFARGGWSCTCPARSGCSHLLAAHLIAAPAYARLITSSRETTAHD